MKYIRTLKNIEKLFQANPQFLTQEKKYDHLYITYSDTEYRINVDMNKWHIWIELNDHEHGTQFYNYVKGIDEKWMYDNGSRVDNNKEVNAKLKADLIDIQNGEYKGHSYQEYTLSKNDITTILDMVYDNSNSKMVKDTVKELFKDIDNVDAKIVYKHTTIDSLYIISSDNKYAISMNKGIWNAYCNRAIFEGLKNIPDLVEYVASKNVKAAETVAETETVETIDQDVETETAESNDQVENNDQQTKKGPTVVNDCQPENEIYLSSIVSHSKLLSQRAPPTERISR